MTTIPRPGLAFDLPVELEARRPPEARGWGREDVRLLVGRRAGGEVTHHAFTELPELLRPGDVLVVNRSATLPAAVDLPGGRIVHFSTPTPEGDWLVEIRLPDGPDLSRQAGEVLELPGPATLTLVRRHASPRLWHARLSGPPGSGTAGHEAGDVPAYLTAYGRPIRYGYVAEEWPLSAYQTVFSAVPGSAEPPSAARPFTAELVTWLVASGVVIVPITLHCGVASPEYHEPPYAEWFEVPEATAEVVNAAVAVGRRVIAIGTTVVRALESAVGTDGRVRPAARWTDLVVTPEHDVRVVTGLLTGLHEPRASHLRMLEAIAGPDLVRACYTAALERRYLWHEFGDVNLLL